MVPRLIDFAGAYIKDHTGSSVYIEDILGERPPEFYQPGFRNNVTFEKLARLDIWSLGLLFYEAMFFK